MLELKGCGVAAARRFTFFDQVHTTGVDVEQTLSARAAMTLGKDMTFRDFAQGAFRMRGIGAGQTICLQMTPQVSQLVRTDVARMRGKPLSEQKPLSEAAPEQALKAICAWLLLNLMRTEDVQACSHLGLPRRTSAHLGAPRRTSAHLGRRRTRSCRSC